MKKYALTLITFLSALAAQAHVEYEIPPHVAYHCGQQPGSTQENLLLPKITQVESGPVLSGLDRHKVGDNLSQKTVQIEA